MKTIKYKDYIAEIVYSDEDRCFVGHVKNIGNDIVSFHGDSDVELFHAFEAVIDLYVESMRNSDSISQKNSVLDILNEYELSMLKQQIQEVK